MCIDRCPAAPKPLLKNSHHRHTHTQPHTHAHAHRHRHTHTHTHTHTQLRTAQKQKQERGQQQAEPAAPQACRSSIPPALAASGIVIGNCVLPAALKMDGQTLVVDHLAGQDQVFVLPLDAAYATGVELAAHRDEGEGLAADAQVVLEVPAAPVAAHRLHLLQLPGVQEGLRGPVAAQVLDVRLPLVLVHAAGGSLGEVALDEGAEGVVRPGGLAWLVVLSQGVVAQPETQQGQGDESLGHYAGYLERERERRSDVDSDFGLDVLLHNYLLFPIATPLSK